MKKKILICFHNYYAINQYIKDFEILSKHYEIKLILSNYLIDKKREQTIRKDISKANIKELFIIPFYEKKTTRSVFSIFKTQFYLKKLKDRIKFSDINCCLADNKFFLWNRIIIEHLLPKECLKIGITHEATPLPLELFEKILKGEDVFDVTKNVHKLRSDTTKEIKKNYSIIGRISNVYNRFMDTVLDRQIIPYIFYGKKFTYKKYDLKTGQETDQFDYRISFVYSSYFFWNEWYKNKNVFLCNLFSNCKCNDDHKEKILFISSGPLYVKPLMEIDPDYKMLDDQILKISNFINKLINENPLLKKIDVKHHPRSTSENIELFEKKLKNKINKRIQIKILSKDEKLSNLSCEYKVAFGTLSSALLDLKRNCNKIDVFCLKSLSLKRFGNLYFLKLFNEGINFYDDFKDELDINNENYQAYSQSVNRLNFSELIDDLISDKF